MSILQYLPSLDHKIETKIYFFKTNCKRNSDNFSFHKKAINVEVLLSVNISGVKFTRGGTVLSRKLPPGLCHFIIKAPLCLLKCHIGVQRPIYHKAHLNGRGASWTGAM